MDANAIQLMSGTGKISNCTMPIITEGGYLLLDPIAFSDAVQIAALGGKLCVPTNWSKDLTGLPLIVDLGECEAWQLDWLQELLVAEHETRRHRPLERAGICAYLRATGSLDQLSSHLASQLLVLPTDHNGNRYDGGALWRFFDPRVFANLCWMLEANHIAALAGPMKIWVFPWFDGWFEYEIPVVDGIARRAEQEPRIAGFMPIGMDLWQRAQHIALINQVAVRLALPRDLLYPQRAAWAQCIETALVVAANLLHWESHEDQALYAEHSVRHGAAFQEHPKLMSYWTLRKQKKARGNWTELTRLLTDEEHTALISSAP